MNRTCLAPLFGLAVLLGVVDAATNAKAAGPLKETLEIVGHQINYAIIDPSSNPPVTVLGVQFSPIIARAGTPQNPGDPLSVNLTPGIINPGADGLGDAGFLDAYYTGPPVDFPANSFFDVFVEITDPGTGQPSQMKNGVVKFFNEAKGFGFVTNPDPPGSPGPSLSFIGEINPAQTGLSFGDVQTVQPSPLDPNANSFFDIFTELHFDGSGPIDPSVPLFRITMTSSVPEPSSLVLGAMGLVTLIGAARKRRSKVSMIGSP